MRQSLMLLGRSGSGKSSVMETLCGSEVKNTRDVQSNGRFGLEVKVKETLGFFSCEHDMQTCTQDLEDCVRSFSGLDVIGFVIRIGRFTPEEKAMIDIFLDVLGEGAFNFTIVIFTHLDNLIYDDVLLSEFLEESPKELQDLLSLCDGRYVGFNNKGSEEDRQGYARSLTETMKSLQERNKSAKYTVDMLEQAREAKLVKDQEKMKVEEENFRLLKEQVRREFDEKLYYRDTGAYKPEDHGKRVFMLERNKDGKYYNASPESAVKIGDQKPMIKPKPAHLKARGKEKKIKRAVVWACGYCSANNNNSRTSCWYCGAEIRKPRKAESGKKAHPASTRDKIPVARLEKTPSACVDKKVVDTEKTLADGTKRTLADGTKKQIAEFQPFSPGVAHPVSTRDKIPVARLEKTPSACVDKKVVGTEKTLADGTKRTLADGTKKQIAEFQPFSPGVDKRELRVVLIGKTGVGKSSTANTILGKTIFKARASPKSVTEKCHYSRIKRFGKKILLVDTPGVFDTSTPKNVIENEIKKCIGISAPGPHAFIFVMSFTNRFTEEEQTVLNYLGDMFGNQMINYLVVLFTGRDQIDKGSTEHHIDEYPEEFRSLVQKAGGGYITFNNRGSLSEKEDDVQALLNRIDQMLKKNGGGYFTSEMFDVAEEVIQRRIANELAEKKEEIRKAVEKEIRKAVEEEMRGKYDAEITHLKELREKDLLKYEVVKRKLKEEQVKSRKNDSNGNLEATLRPLIIDEMRANAEKKLIHQIETSEGPEKTEAHRQLAGAGQEIQQLLQHLRRNRAEAEVSQNDEFEENAIRATEKYLVELRDEERGNIEKEKGLLQKIKEKLSGIRSPFFSLFR